MAQQKRPNRVLVTFSDDMYQWVSEQSKQLGLPMATTVVVLVNDAKRMKEDQERSKENADKMMDIMKGFVNQSPVELQEAMKLAIESASDRDPQIDPTDGMP